MKTEGLTANKLANPKGSQPDQDISLDEMFGWYLNITFAVLFVFIIANFLFKVELKEEAKRVGDERDIAEWKWEEVENSEEGQQYVKREEALINLQKQELLNALDKVVAEDREVFGLSAFSSVSDGGKTSFNVNEILSGEKVFDNPHVKKCFVDGSVLAKQKLPYLPELREDWLKRVLDKAKMHILGKDEKHRTIADDSKVVEKTNQSWLFEEISKRTGTLYNDYCDFQAAVLTRLYRHYFNNPQLLDGTEIARLLNNYFKATPEVKNSLLKEIEEKLYQHAKTTLENQGVMVISGVSE